MKFDKSIVARNSIKVFHLMKGMYHYTFDDLQVESKLNDTDLCLAIGQLMQEGKLRQVRNSSGIYYAIDVFRS